MISIIATISCLFLLVGLLAPVDGFGVQPKGSLSSLLSENSRKRSSLRYQNEESPTSTVSAPRKMLGSRKIKPVIKHENFERTFSIETDNDWDLREDWALEDSVPRYTVGSEATTFWTQLRHSTPELAHRSEVELEQRYKEWYSSAEDSLLVKCGASPTILSDWWVTTGAKVPSTKNSQKNTEPSTMMCGSRPDGSQIWFLLKCAGTLGDTPTSFTASPQNPISQDTLDDCFISASIMSHTTSYIESSHGVVYELGAPRCEAHKVHQPRDSLDTYMGISRSQESSEIVSSDDPKDIAFHLDTIQKNVMIAAAQNAGALSAIMAASTTAVCLTQALGEFNQ